MGYLPYPLDVIKSTKFILIMEIINTKKIHTPSFPLKKERKKKKKREEKPSSPS
jgi:hypothetical protein